MTRCFYDKDYRVITDDNTELFPFIIESENRTTISEVDTIGSSNYLEEAEKKNIDLSQMFGVVMSGNIDI